MQQAQAFKSLVFLWINSLRQEGKGDRLLFCRKRGQATFLYIFLELGLSLLIQKSSLSPFPAPFPVAIDTITKVLKV